MYSWLHNSTSLLLYMADTHKRDRRALAQDGITVYPCAPGQKVARRMEPAGRAMVKRGRSQEAPRDRDEAIRHAAAAEPVLAALPVDFVPADWAVFDPPSPMSTRSLSPPPTAVARPARATQYAKAMISKAAQWASTDTDSILHRLLLSEVFELRRLCGTDETFVRMLASTARGGGNMLLQIIAKSGWVLSIRYTLMILDDAADERAVLLAKIDYPLAADACTVTLARLFLCYPWSIQPTSPGGKTLFHVWAERGNADLIRCCGREVCDTCAPDYIDARFEGQSALDVAFKESLPAAEALLEIGICNTPILIARQYLALDREIASAQALDAVAIDFLFAMRAAKSLFERYRPSRA